jgi:phosphodiesterase/alkaline phosphatase D-like protein
MRGLCYRWIRNSTLVVIAALLSAGRALAQAPAPDPLIVTGTTGTTIGLQWNDIYDNEDGFRIERWDPISMIMVSIASLPANTTNYVDTGLVPNTTYNYQVVEFNGDSDSYASYAMATATPIPAPDPMMITKVTGTTIALTWNDVYNNEDGFRIDRWNPNTFTMEPLATLGANITNFLDTGLTPGNTYFYGVVAFNSGGDSYGAYTYGTPTPVAAPEPILITKVTGTTIGFSWNDIYNDEDGFRIERWDPVSMSMLPVAYESANVTNFLDTGLIPGTSYFYHVVAYNSGGDSYPAYTSATATPVPAPEPIVITKVTGTTIGFSWNDIYNDEDGFRIERWDPVSMSMLPVAYESANVTNFLDTGLIPGTSYFYDVVAYNSGGDSYPAYTYATATPVPAPEPIVITKVTGTTIGFSWNDIYDDEDGFRIERWDPVSMSMLPVAYESANVTNFLDTGLIPGTSYFYDVVAYNSGGDSYPAYTYATATPVPAPEPLIITKVTGTTISLAWNDIFDDEDGFRIERWNPNTWTTEPVGYVGADITTFTDVNLKPGVTYSYDVVAFNSGGDSYPAYNYATATPVAGPDPLTITKVTGSTVHLQWADHYDDEQGFRIEISTNGDDYGLLSTVEPDVTNYVATDLTAENVYYFRVVEFGPGGDSFYSQTVSASATPVPAPDPLVVQNVGATQIELSWTDIYDYEDGFRLERSADSIHFTPIAYLPADTTDYTDTNLIPGTFYSYRVAAYNGEGDSFFSMTVNATTLPLPPFTPADLVASASSQSVVTLTWADMANNETGFRIERSLDGVNFDLAASVDSNVTGYVDSGLTAATTYYYRVAATNAGGSSPYSDLAATTTLPNPPSAPSALTATALSQTNIALVWVDNAGNETGFQVERSLDGISFVQIAAPLENSTSYVDNAVGANTTYYYRVRSVNAGGNSAYSVTATATTLPNPPAAPSALIATPVSQTRIDLSWTDNASNETSFNIQRSIDGITFDTIASVGANVTTYSDTGLAAVTSYHYRITAGNAGGTSAASNLGSATTLDYPPTAPSNLTATTVSATQINLSWTDNANNESAYLVERSTDGVIFTQVASLGANVTIYSNTGLTPATQYSYRVRAMNSAGNSGYSSTANTTTLDVPPAAPTGLTATTISATQIDLSWTDNANNESGYLVERSIDGVNFTQIASLGANVATYLNTGLTPATQYYYRVRATNSAGSSDYSSTANTTTLDVPPIASTGLTATTVSATQINLSWTDNANNESGYLVERSTDGVNFTQVTSLGANVTTYSNTGLIPATQYYYRVRATNSAGNSGYSSTATAATLDVPPAAPTGLTAATISATQINLNWADNANNESGYLVERSTDGVNFTQIANLGANVTSYSNTGLTPATQYYYRVRATNSAGNSGYSSTATAATLDVPPAAPTGLTTATISATQINLSWTDNANNESGYLVERSIDGVTFTQIATLGANVTTYSNTGLAPATRYYYRVRATNSAGNSGYSNVVNATTLDVPPAAPGNLTATAVSSNRVDLAWTDNAGNESGFLIERSTDGVNFTQIATVTANVTAYSNTGLSAATTYYYRVRATNSAGNSGYSNSASATTGAAAPPAAPSGLALSAVSASQINLNWNDNSSNEAAFLIERSLDGVTFTQIASVGTNVHTYSAIGLAANTKYYFRVRATNSAGNSAYSNTANVKTAH